MRKIVIIGNGISGITCARHIRKSCDDQITIISSETEHFYSRTALMYVYMGHMKYDHLKPYEDFFWKKNRLDLIHDRVTSIDIQTRQLHIEKSKLIDYDILIIASGSKTKKYGWPGQDLSGVVGLYNYQDLQQIELQTKNITSAVIAGGGLIGVELAEMLHTRNIEVTLLVRDKYYWGSVLPLNDGKLVGKHIEAHGIRIIYETELKEIIGNNEGKVSKIMTNTGQLINCEFVGITTGVTPNVDFLKDSGIEISKGILIDQYFQTNIENVYAIGDCAEFRDPPSGRKSIEQIWYTGRMHGETLAQTICGNRIKYNPGPFFNSAKFFDLEYQTYGIVPSKFSAEENSFHWKHPGKEIAITFVFENQNRLFKGLNCFGTRLRHENFDQWLKERVSVDHVIANFSSAVFDKEFSNGYLDELISSYNSKTGSAVKKMKKKLFNFS